MIGLRFGKLVILSKGKVSIYGNRFWLAKCDCGVSKEVSGADLKAGKIVSCGCFRRSLLAKVNKENLRFAETIGTNHPLYSVWYAMKRRCFNKNNKEYHRYGGRGITVCERWLHSFQNFLVDMGERPEGMQIDRIDNNKGYSPDNCRWATRIENCNNKG